MAIDTDKLEAVAWMYRHHEFGCQCCGGRHCGGTPDDYIGWTETPLTDLTRANEIIAEKEAEIARLEARVTKWEKTLRAIEHEAKMGNDRIRMKALGTGSAAVKVAQAMHRCEKMANAALKEPSQ